LITVCVESDYPGHLLNRELALRYATVRGSAFAANIDRRNYVRSFGHLTAGVFESFGAAIFGYTEGETVRNVALLHATSALGAGLRGMTAQIQTRTSLYVPLYETTWSPPQPRVVPPVFHLDGRDFVVVETSVGRQGFYRSSGINSGMRDQWLPFDEDVAGRWLNKAAYTEEGGFPEGTPLHRFGSQEFLQISQGLTGQPLPQGAPLQSTRDLNLILDFFNARTTSFNMCRPVPDPG
jgi:hypothetical protein